MKIARLLFVFLVFGFASSSNADSEVMPRPVVFTSPSGIYYFKLVPSEDFDDSKTEGFMYRVSHGSDELLYKTWGWYSFRVLISGDGKHLVRVGPWPRYTWPPEETVALAFYTDGVEVRRYYVSDLVVDQAELERSVSHYTWGGDLEWSGSSWDGRVQVRTVEDKTLIFDLTSGELIN